MIKYCLLISRLGKLRLARWYSPHSLGERKEIIGDLTERVIERKGKMCNIIEYNGSKVVYKRYASLFFVVGIEEGENELMVLDLIHRFVEVLDRYFENVCELDLIFNFQKAYHILDNFILGGEVQEMKIENIIDDLKLSDDLEKDENNHKIY